MQTDMTTADTTPATDLIELATELTVAWLGNRNTVVAAHDVPAFLAKMHGAVTKIAAGPAADDNAPSAQVFTLSTGTELSADVGT